MGALGLTFGHGCRQAKLQPHTGPGCKSINYVRGRTLKQGQCADFTDFFSFNAYRYHAEKKFRDFSGWNCTVAVFEERRCKGAYLVIGDLRYHTGECGSSVFKQNGTIPHPAKSAMLLCMPDIPAPVAKPKYVTAKTDVLFNAATKVPVVVKTVVATTKKATPKSIIKSTTTIQSVIQTIISTSSHICTTCNTTMTEVYQPVIVVSSSSVPNTTTTQTSIIRTATIKQTTTIIAPPTATVEGTTTVWVASTSSSQKVRTSSFVVTITDAAKMRRAMEESSSSIIKAVAATETAQLVRRARPDSTECYASIDGHWIVSSCALPLSPLSTSTFTSISTIL